MIINFIVVGDDAYKWPLGYSSKVSPYFYALNCITLTQHKCKKDFMILNTMITPVTSVDIFPQGFMCSGISKSFKSDLGQSKHENWSKAWIIMEKSWRCVGKPQVMHYVLFLGGGGVLRFPFELNCNAEENDLEFFTEAFNAD